MISKKRLSRVYFATILFVCSLAVGTTFAASDVSELYAQGQESLQQDDVVGAMRYFSEAAESGHAASQTRLAWLLDGAELNEAAADWYRKAAEQGDAGGEFGLASMYSKGEGVAQDKEKFIKWASLAAEQSHPEAMGAMSNAYENGLYGVAADPGLAKQWVDRGLDKNQAWAMHRMARAYRFGELGLPIDIAKAEEFETKVKALTPE